MFNKFSKQEASRQDLRDELADAIISGVPRLTGVPEKCLAASGFHRRFRHDTLRAPSRGGMMARHHRAPAACPGTFQFG
ncbi:DUF2478 domain-containing protein [Bradyrhizobium sp. 200]|nr:DUF2478 domain-containing protein [Bradyrhizobium sp. 200]